MTIENDFLAFAVGTGANVLTQSEYVAETSLIQNGFTAGIAPSVQLNKVWRQSSIMAAVIASFIVAETGQTAIDDGTTATLLANFTNAVNAASKNKIVLTDTGTANAYAAANPVPLTALPTSTGFTQTVKIAHLNTGTSTYAPDGLATAPIYGLGGAVLQGGELPANGVATLVSFVDPLLNSGNLCWVLYECVGGAQPVAPATASQHALQAGQLFQSITATVASNALTGTLVAPTAFSFRNPTLTNGAPVFGSVASNLTLTVPSGATLGTISAQSARLVWLVAYNGGVPALCVVNLAGGVNLDETTLISTTAISAGATAANVIYSTAAITNSPFRVVGFSDITETTAGTWATGPTTVQGMGGQALAALSSIGYGQTWQSFTSAQRQLATTFYNTTGRPITVIACGESTSANNGMQIVVNGVTITGSTSSASLVICAVTAIVPPGGSYIATMPAGGASFSSWEELR